MEFFRGSEQSIDATVVHKQALAERLVAVIAANKQGIEEEKRLKKELAKLMQANETVDRVTRKVIRKFSPSKELERYLKDNGLWRAVTVRESKVLKGKVVALAEDNKELQELLDHSYKEQNRFNLAPPEERL